MTVSVSRDELIQILSAVSSFHQRLGRIETLLTDLNTKEDKLLMVIDDLQAELANNTTVVGSVKQLVQNIKAALDSAGTDQAKLQAIKDGLAANDKTLADLVVQNTPAAVPTPTPAPPTA